MNLNKETKANHTFEFEEWKKLKIFLRFLGIFPADDSNPYTRKVVLIVTYLVWILPCIIYFTVIVADGLLKKKITDIVDCACVAIAVSVSLALRKKLKTLVKIFASFDQLGIDVKLGKVSVKRHFYTNCLASSALFFFDVIRIFIVNENTSDLHLLRSYITCYDLLSYSTKLLLSMLIYFMLLTTSFIFIFMQSISMIVCYLTLMKCYLLLNYRNAILRNILSAGINISKLKIITSDYSKVVVAIKNANQTLSPIVFVLFCFWTFNACSTLSFILDFKIDPTNVVICAFSLLKPIYEVVLLVNTANKVGNEALLSLKIIMAHAEMDSTVIHSTVKLMNLQITYSAFKRYRKEIALVPMEMLKVDKKQLLTFFGIVISYEIILLQLKSNPSSIISVDNSSSSASL